MKYHSKSLLETKFSSPYVERKELDVLLEAAIECELQVQADPYRGTILQMKLNLPLRKE